jgi:hypothetical protein
MTHVMLTTHRRRFSEFEQLRKDLLMALRTRRADPMAVRPPIRYGCVCVRVVWVDSYRQPAVLVSQSVGLVAKACGVL